jgi:hypothetical protein
MTNAHVRTAPEPQKLGSSWTFLLLVVGASVMVVAALSAGVTWFMLRSERRSAPSSAELDSASDPSERGTPTRAAGSPAGIPLTCAKVTSCCRQIAVRSSGPPGNCDGFMQLADQACKQALEGFRSTAERLGTSCD